MCDRIATNVSEFVDHDEQVDEQRRGGGSERPHRSGAMPGPDIEHLRSGLVKHQSLISGIRLGFEDC